MSHVCTLWGHEMSRGKTHSKAFSRDICTCILHKYRGKDAQKRDAEAVLWTLAFWKTEPEKWIHSLEWVLPRLIS
jgi:hypothetical protein